ncbi:hypothetical protein RRG08_020168 [Elysia crispata]|uniref:Uncharacterized protein n=1 Tax=Elysia crispata TaxID=231223 RepID=A0AAE0YZU2_9GAST|nr:hypothetical protein RRG08_020168 [Elysia crispata]
MLPLYKNDKPRRVDILRIIMHSFSSFSNKDLMGYKGSRHARAFRRSFPVSHVLGLGGTPSKTRFLEILRPYKDRFYMRPDRKPSNRHWDLVTRVSHSWNRIEPARLETRAVIDCRAGWILLGSQRLSPALAPEPLPPPVSCKPDSRIAGLGMRGAV